VTFEHKFSTVCKSQKDLTHVVRHCYFGWHWNRLFAKLSMSSLILNCWTITNTFNNYLLIR